MPILSVLSPIERRLTRYRLNVDPAPLEGHPVTAVVVGEAPGPRSSPACPMFPFPAQSSGGWLRTLSGIDVAEYLRRFARRDLLRTYPLPDGRWRKAETEAGRAAALALLAEVGSDPSITLVLLGRNVVEAFGAMSIAMFTAAQLCLGGPMVVRLPHPSGRTRAMSYGAPADRAKARHLLRTAAGLDQPAGAPP